MLAFVHIRKTAGSTIDMILRQSLGTRHCRVRHGKSRAASPRITANELDRCRWIYWNMASISGHGIVPHSDLECRFPEIRFFTFLRDPVARCASDYQFRVVRGGLTMPFHQWIKTDMARNQQVKKLAGVENADEAIAAIDRNIGFVGLVEQFHHSLVLFQQWCADPCIDIRYMAKNVAKSASIKSELLADTTSRRQLAEANHEDQALYDYVARSVFPRQAHTYGVSLSADVLAFESNNHPPPVYPRQILSTFLREVVYKPLAPVLRSKTNEPGSSPKGLRPVVPNKTAA